MSLILNDSSICPERPCYRVGYASGAFDLLHIGHLRYLQQAARHCQELIVGIPSDAVIAMPANKGHPPLMSCAERQALVGALRMVSRTIAVTVSMEDAPAFCDFIQTLPVEALFIGAEWQDSPRWQRLAPLLTAQGIAVHFLPRTPGISSTALRQVLNR